MGNSRSLQIDDVSSPIGLKLDRSMHWFPGVYSNGNTTPVCEHLCEYIVHNWFSGGSSKSVSELNASGFCISEQWGWRRGSICECAAS